MILVKYVLIWFQQKSKGLDRRESMAHLWSYTLLMLE